MYLHKEGHRLVWSVLAIIVAITLAMVLFCKEFTIFCYIAVAIMLLFWLALASFFRMPKRVLTYDDGQIMAPADGHICTIEQTFEKEYLNSECIMVSIFMNGTDVHVNRYPANGKVEYVKYHKGNYFVASYPKSSIMNERSSIGMLLENGDRILVRQVAGIMARRIVCYAHEGDVAKQNTEMGFIKFGSRVDLYLPLGSEINVALNTVVRGGITTIAKLR